MKIKITQLVLLLVSVVLMMLPSGIAFKASGESGIEFINYYSYFNSMNFGYGNWAPLITLILTVITITLLVLSSKHPKLEKTIMKFLIACIALMMFSFIVFESLTTISLLVMVIHLFVLLSLLFLRKKDNLV